MTVSTTIASKTYDGDGSTVIFPTVFAFFAEADIEVIERVVASGLETVKTLTTDYTVTGGNGAPGNVNALAAPPATVSWTIRRVLSETQETDLPVAGSLPSTSVESIGDRNVMMIQQHSEEFERTLTFPKTDSASLSTELPSSVARANKFLGFNSSGAVIATAGTTTIETGFGSGTAAAPSLTFVDDGDTGVYRSAVNEIGFAAEGNLNLAVGSGGAATVNYAQIVGSITGAAVALQAQGSDTNVGVRLQPKGAGQVEGPDGTAALPGYTFNADLDTGMSRPAADTLAFSTGGTVRARIDSSGRLTLPFQPAFTAGPTTTILNVTGNATVYTIVFGTAYFDQGGVWDDSTTFTAPVTGKYLLSVHLVLAGITAAADLVDIKLVTSNRVYRHVVADANDLSSIQNYDMTVVADMSAADTAHVTVAVSGEASDLVDIMANAAAAPETYFSGCLLA